MASAPCDWSLCGATRFTVRAQKRDSAPNAFSHSPAACRIASKNLARHSKKCEQRMTERRMNVARVRHLSRKHKGFRDIRRRNELRLHFLDEAVDKPPWTGL